MQMYTCECGRTFPGTLEGGWEGREHAEATQHRLTMRREAPRRADHRPPLRQGSPAVG